MGTLELSGVDAFPKQPLRSELLCCNEIPPLNNRKSACLVTELFEVPVADIFRQKNRKKKKEMG